MIKNTIEKADFHETKLLSKLLSLLRNLKQVLRTNNMQLIDKHVLCVFLISFILTNKNTVIDLIYIYIYIYICNYVLLVVS